MGTGMKKTNSDLKFQKVLFSTEKQKKEEEFKFSRKIVVYVAYLIIIGLAFYFVFISNFFRIKSISVENVKSVEIEDYVNSSLLGKNILLMLPGRYLEDLVAKFPVLEQARIVRGLPDTVRVIIDEREQKFIWCNLKACYEVDNNGYIFNEVEKTSAAVALTDLGNVEISELKQVASKNFIKFFVKALEQIGDAGIEVTEAQIDKTTFKLEFISAEGWRIIMDTSGSLNNQVSAVRQVFEKNKPDIHEYIDVRVEGVVFIK